MKRISTFNTTYFGISVILKYYQCGAMRVGSTLYYTLSDHLGSTSITIDPSGNKTETRYKPWGEVRYQSGTLPTDRTYTGQRSYTSDFGLMYYNARWYDSSIGRFAQADIIIPGGVQGYDRYAYVNNSPINLADPSGHSACDGITSDQERALCENGGYGQRQKTDDLLAGHTSQYAASSDCADFTGLLCDIANPHGYVRTKTDQQITIEALATIGIVYAPLTGLAAVEVLGPMVAL